MQRFFNLSHNLSRGWDLFLNSEFLLAAKQNIVRQIAREMFHYAMTGMGVAARCYTGQ